MQVCNLSHYICHVNLVYINVCQLDGRGFQTSDPTESVWDVEFGLVELKWTSEEYPLGVSHEDIVVAHRRDIPNVDEISTMVRDLW